MNRHAVCPNDTEASCFRATCDVKKPMQYLFYFLVTKSTVSVLFCLCYYKCYFCCINGHIDRKLHEFSGFLRFDSEMFLKTGHTTIVNKYIVANPEAKQLQRRDDDRKIANTFLFSL